MRFQIRDSFPAAHRIRIDTRGTREPVHVHHWRVDACFEGSPPVEPQAVAARDLIASWVGRHRGRSLNDVAPFERINPTAEEVARQLFGELQLALPDLRVCSVTIGEAAGFSATYWPPGGTELDRGD